MGDIKIGKYTVNEDQQPDQLEDGRWLWLSAVSDDEILHYCPVNLWTDTPDRPSPEEFIAGYEAMMRKVRREE